MINESGMDKYRPDRKGLVLKYSSMASAGIIAAGSMIALGACSGKREQWAETSGKAGQINLEAVEEAMQKSKDVTEFEKRVNEIYTGDEMVLIEVKNEGNEQLVSGYADLNDNNEINYEEDEKLFTFRRWFEGDKPSYEMRGYGVNSYYHRPYTGMDLFTTWLLVSALTRPMYTVPVYHTTIADRGALRSYRADYRRTPSYRNQVDTNRNFQARMSAKHGTDYKTASPSASRRTWATRKGVNLDKATKVSKSSFSRRSGGAKSSWSSRARGFGGFKGGSAGAGIGFLCRREF